MLARLFSQGDDAPPLLLRLILATFLMGGTTVLLWFNEGRINYARVAAAAIPIEVEALPGVEDGEFVAARGPLRTETLLGDPPYLRPGPYLSLERDVEIYAWIETTVGSVDSDNPSPDNYAYSLGWTDNPMPPSEMAFPDGRINPELPLSARTFQVDEAWIGDASFDPRSAALPTAQPLTIRSDHLGEVGGAQALGEFIFIAKGTPAQPALGDLRLRYRVVESGQKALLFGQKRGGRLEPYVLRGNRSFYRLFFADRSDALLQMGREFTFLRWGSRILALIGLSIAIWLVMRPLTVLGATIPVLHSMSRAAVVLAAVALAGVYAVIVSLLAFLFYHPVILLILLTLTAMAGALAHGLWRRDGRRP